MLHVPKHPTLIPPAFGLLGGAGNLGDGLLPAVFGPRFSPSGYTPPFRTKAYTNNVAVTLIGLGDISLSVNGSTANYMAGVVEYCVIADDGTERQIEDGLVFFQAYLKGGSVSSLFTESNGQLLSAGTLTTTFGMTGAASALVIQGTFNSSLTPVTRIVYYRATEYMGRPVSY